MNLVTTKTNATLFDYDQQKLACLFAQILKENTTAQTREWLNQTELKINETQILNTAFTLAPRKAGKTLLKMAKDQTELTNTIVPGFVLHGWTVDRLVRVYLLLQMNETDKNRYFDKIENLFTGAEMNEQVALYGALPLLAYPQHWTKQCADGIRSNVADVLQAIMCNNPYPARYLDEAAWNQMVLKAFFTEKKIEQIVGLDERANPQLAAILVDYAHERWAAHRTVHPLLWRCVGKFINAENISDIERAYHSKNQTEVAAAALACSASFYLPAKALLNENTVLKSLIDTGLITWDTIAQNAVLF